MLPLAFLALSILFPPLSSCSRTAFVVWRPSFAFCRLLSVCCFPSVQFLHNSSGVLVPPKKTRLKEQTKGAPWFGRHCPQELRGVPQLSCCPGLAFGPLRGSGAVFVRRQKAAGPGELWSDRMGGMLCVERSMVNPCCSCGMLTRSRPDDRGGRRDGAHDEGGITTPGIPAFECIAPAVCSFGG